jgi:hypothetical protein
VLAGDEWHQSLGGKLPGEVGGEMSEVLLLRAPHGVIGQEDQRVLAGETAIEWYMSIQASTLSAYDIPL